MVDLQEAMRSRDGVRRNTLRLVVADVHNTEIARGRTLSDSDILEVISRQVKQRRESIELFTKGARTDLVEREEAELNLLLAYLPQPMEREELVALAEQAAAEVGARGPGDKGKVMARLMPQLKGRAEGKEVSEIVSDLLARL